MVWFRAHAIPRDGVVRASWSFGEYENEYVKEHGKWKFKKIRYNRIFSTPYEDGWVKTPIKPGKSQFAPKDLPETGSSPF